MQKQEQSERLSESPTIEQHEMMARVSFLQDALLNNNNMALAHQAPLIPPSFLGSASFYDTMNKASFEPTNSDVLLGRGVATNRHPGNENFRRIVSHHVDAYMTSTKKQKMTISRSIVNQVRTQLDPPGKFLEKNPLTGLWHEVDDKRAFEKTAQALRDGAAPLRKQQLTTEDNKVLAEPSKSPDSSSYEKGATSLDCKPLESGKPSSKSGDTTVGSTTSEALIKLVPKKGKRHRRTKTAPVNLSDVFSSGSVTSATSINAGPRPKKLRSNPDIAAAMTNPPPTEMDKLFMAEMLSQGNSLFAPFEESQSQQISLHHKQVHSVLQQHQHQQGASVDSNSNHRLFSTQHQHHQRNPSLTTSFFNALQFSDQTLPLTNSIQFSQISSAAQQVPQQNHQQSRRVNNEGQNGLDANKMMLPQLQQSSSLMNNNFMALNTNGGGPNNNNSYLNIGQHQQQQKADYYAPLPINKPILGKESSATTLDFMLKALEPLAHQLPQHSSESQMQTKMASSLIHGADLSTMASSSGGPNPTASNTLYHNTSVTDDVIVDGKNRNNNVDQVQEFAMGMGSDEHFFGLSVQDETIGDDNEFNDETALYQNKGG